MPQLRPILVGGTGRSGSTITGFLFGTHPAVWVTRPREVRFITDLGGLLDLALGVTGRVRNPHDPRARAARTMKEQLLTMPLPQCMARRWFERRLRGSWWMRSGPDGQSRGLHRGVQREQLDLAIAAFDRAFCLDPLQASRTLVHDLLDAPARAQRATAWADTTPQNAENAHRIVELMPDAKVVFMLRDGRDTVASVLHKNWGPSDPLRGLEWWRASTLRAHDAMARLTPDQGITLRLDQLIESEREESLRRLFALAELEPALEVRAFFDARMSADRAHLRRWPSDIPTELQTTFNTRYAEIHEELTAKGVDLPPL